MFKQLGRLSPPMWRAVLLSTLVVGVSTFGIVGCGDDDDGGNSNNNNTGSGLCQPGETKYYCIETTITMDDVAETDYDVEDICSDGDGVITPDCNVQQNGDNVSISCSSTDQVSATCTVKTDYTISGTMNDNLIDMSGTVTVTPQGSCPIGADEFDIAFHGTRVDGPSAPCGPDSPNEDSFDLTITNPGGTISPTLDTVVGFGDPSSGYTVTATFSDPGGVTYTTNLYVPPVSSAPATFPVVDPGTSDTGEAEVMHIEAKYSTPIYTFTLASATGTLNVTSATAGGVAGSFNASGSGDVIEGLNQRTETRTLAGDFSVSYPAPPPTVGGAGSESDPESYKKRIVRSILRQVVNAASSDGRGVVAP
jgi:hypothetical protein